MVDVGLFDTLEELAGVGGERFDVAALALGVDGVKGERGLAGAGDARDDGEPVVLDIDVDVFEIMGPRTADDDGVTHDGSQASVGWGRKISRRRRQAPITMAESAMLKSGQW